MVTSRKYITMNIRRPEAHNLDSSSKTSSLSGSSVNTSATSQLSPKKILSMHINNQHHHHFQQSQLQQQPQNQLKTYLPLKRSINTVPNKKPTFTTSSSFSASLNTPNNTHNSHAEKSSHITTSTSSSMSKPSSNSQSIVNEIERDYNNNHASAANEQKLINIQPKRLVNATAEAQSTTAATATQRLRQSFFMSEFPAGSPSNTKSTDIKVTNIPSSVGMGKASTFIERCYDKEAMAQSTDNQRGHQIPTAPNAKGSFEYCASSSSAYSASKYAAPASSTLPSKNSLSRSSLIAKASPTTKLTVNKSGDKVEQPQVTQIISRPAKATHQLSKSHAYDQPQSLPAESDKGTSEAANTAGKASLSRGSSYKALVLNKTKKASANELNQSISAPRAEIKDGYYPSETELQQTANSTHPKASRSNAMEASNCVSTRTESGVDSDSQRFDSNSTGLVDQMASFIDELKDFIDDRLIDTTSQLEMANQRITGLYYNLNYLTKEFVELKNQNETLKKELQYQNQIAFNASQENSYYQKLNQSRRKNQHRTKSDKSCDMPMNSSSKTSSIETASSSTSESLAMSQNALGCSSHESHQNQRNHIQSELKHSDIRALPDTFVPQQDETMRHLSRNEMILILKNKEKSDHSNKLESSSSSVNSVNFYDNMPQHVDKIDLEASQYLRTSSQIELNNIVEGKYTSIEFVHGGHAENYGDEMEEEEEEGEEEDHSELNEEMVLAMPANRSQLLQAEVDEKFLLLKEADLKNSFKQTPEIIKPVYPYTNFRDFDAQYSWDYTDNLVNKFTAKAAHLKS